MTKKTQDSLNRLLDELKTADLDDHYDYLANKYFISEDGNDDIWKYKKKFYGVVTWYVTWYELWHGRLIARVYFIWQGWKDKKKTKRIVEVQRYLGGCDYKLSRCVYYGHYGTKCLIGYQFYEENNCDRLPDWMHSKITTNDLVRECYIGSYYYETDIINPHFARYVMSKKCENSVHKYCAFEYTDRDDNYIFEWLAMYEKHPQLEFFAKLDLLWTLSTGMNSFRWSKKGLAILGLESKDELPYLKACGKLTDYRKYKDELIKYNIDTSDKFYAYRRLKSRNIEVNNKILNYLFKLGGAWGRTGLYIDYLSFVDELGLPKTNKIFYPENLEKAHDKLFKKIKMIESKEKDESIRKRIIKKLGKLRYGNEDYIITPASSSFDLINESKKLNHCVRTYVDRYAQGATNIFLIRKREDVNEPFYTLELSNSKSIIQLRGNHNCKPTEGVIGFVNEWAKKNKITGAYIN